MFGNVWKSIPEIQLHQFYAGESAKLKYIHRKSLPNVSSLSKIDNIPAKKDLDDVTHSCDITNEQKIQFRQLLEDHKNLFSDISGRTRKYEHINKWMD